MLSEPSMRPKPWVVNVGLPRTGTTSFTQAAVLLGLRSLHIWDAAEPDADLLRAVHQNTATSRRFLSEFHALADTPFYALRNAFEAHHPETRLLYTTRPREEWVESMIRHGRAGGEFLARLYGLRGIPWCEPDRPALSAAFDQHHETVCHGLPAIDLSGPDDGERWRVFCSCLPDFETHFEQVRELAWPHENRGT